MHNAKFEKSFEIMHFGAWNYDMNRNNYDNKAKSRISKRAFQENKHVKFS